MRVKSFTLLFSIIALSCSKDNSPEAFPICGPAPDCFQGKYVGRGCWDVIQVLSPVNGALPTGSWYKGTVNGAAETYDNAIGINDLPAAYKDGKPFYFKIRAINEHGFITTECSPTTHIIAFDHLSKTGCADTPGASH